MSRRTISLGIVVAVLALALAVAPAFAAGRTFIAHLSGANEVPAVESAATGQVVLHLNGDGTELSYRLIVSSLENVTGAHIHLAPEGVNGPIVAFLASTQPGVSHGLLAQGTITSGDLIGPLVGMDLLALVEAIEAGDAYVNVHTVAHPAGEIRGQLR